MKVRFLIFLSAGMLMIFLFPSCGGNETDEAMFQGEVAEFEQVAAVDLAEDISTREIVTKKGESAPISSSGKGLRRIPTGQKLCYDDTTEIICPEPGERFFGQDSQTAVGVRSYVDNGNETVTDDVTGYTWQKTFKSDMTWYEAESYCRNLSIAGYIWRLPKPHELRTLVDYGVYNPSIDVLTFPDTPSDWFWASKHAYFNDVSKENESSWIISFFDGFVEYTSRYNYYSVRCIKAN